MPILNKYIKLALFTSLQLFTLGKAAPNDPVALPQECKDLDLISGNPMTAKTVLFGENHDDINCYSSMRVCAEALTKNIKRSNRIALLEGIPSDLQTSCSDQPERQLDTIFDECNGYIPNHKLQKIIKSYKEQHAYEDLQLQFDAAYLLKPTLDSSDFKFLVNGFIDEYSARLNKEVEAQQEKFKQYKATHPKADQNKFYVIKTNEQNMLKVILKTLKSIDNQVKFGLSYEKAIKAEVTDKLASAQAESNKLDKVMRSKHKELAITVKKHSQNKEKVVGFVSSLLFKPRSQSYREILNQQKIINEFYEDLDKYAHENPYAVLSCPL